MGKKQHSKDRMFITTTEWAAEWGGAKNRDLRTPFKRLPFYCCANIVPYILKFGKDPVSGKPLAAKDLIKLRFHKNGDGEYHCPVLHKTFTEYSHIVAVKTTGNVFSYEAIQELNMKQRNWKELLTDEPFTREDLLTIQDPQKLDVKVLTDFDHVKKGLELKSDELEKAKEDPAFNINVSDDVRRMLSELGTERAVEALRLGGGGGKAREERAAALAALDVAKRKAAEEMGNGGEEGGQKKKDEAEPPLPMSIVDAASAALSGTSAAAARGASRDKALARVAAHAAGERAPVEANSRLVKSQYTSGRTSRSFTSTAYDVVTETDYEMVRVEKTPKKKGYLRMHTSMGDLNLELHCDLVPRACENFLTLAEQGYYDNVIFHRNIRNFMVQGGDPTGTGKGGASIWGKPFKDEFTSKLTHSERGVLSMANSGPHSNGSQFFILYKSAPHLNYKHTVFGKVVGGLDVLSDLERVSVDADDRPLKEIKILKVSIFTNPYTEVDEEEKKAEAEAQAAINHDENEKMGSWFSNPNQDSGLVAHKAGVGKYLKPPISAQKSGATATPVVVVDSAEQPLKRRKEVASGVHFSNFSGW
eukprot:SM000150S01732  [mRNA]  locus=s150:222290:225887:- [translate_table: standard]